MFCALHMGTGPAHSCTISISFLEYYNTAAISAPGNNRTQCHLCTHLHLIQVKHVRVKCLDQGHNIETMSQYWKRRNPAPSGMRNRTAGSNVLTITPRPSLFKVANSQIIYLVTDILCCRLLLISNLSVKSSKSPSCRQSWAKGEGFCWILLRTHHRGELVFCVGPHDVFPDSLAWPAYWFSMDRSVTLNKKNQTLFLITDWWMLALKV